MLKGSSRRIISVFLPTWPTDRLRRTADNGAPPADQPVVTAMRDGQRRVVAACDAVAANARLAPGMSIAHARALVPGLSVLESDPDADRRDLQKLGVAVLRRFSPLVALDQDDGLLLDATGCAHLYGGEQAMVSAVASYASDLGIAARVACAGTIGAAHGLARFGLAHPTLVVARCGEKQALARLPVAALRLSSETRVALARVGIEKVAQLYGLPRAPLVRRYGATLVLRLEQAIGRAAEPFEAITAPETIEVRQPFLEPISTPEQLQEVTKILAELLCERLATAALGARQIDLRFYGVDSARQAVRAGTAAPSRDPRHLAKLLSLQLDHVDPGFGIELMSLSAPVVEPLGSRQFSSSLVDEAGPTEMSTLVDTLMQRLGGAHVFRAAPVESDVPERSFKRLAALAPAMGTSWPAGWPRPARLLRPPEPIETMALLPDHPPVQFTWRGDRHRVTRADGPERIFGEWWRRDAETSAVRDYFQVEDEAGARFWVFRSGDGIDPATGAHRWWLHGFFA